jgi:hypothetical protein
MTIVDLKLPKRAKRGLPLDQATDASRFYNRVVRDIVADLGGRRELTRIEGELIGAFAGGATVLRYLNRPKKRPRQRCRHRACGRERF